MNKKLADLLRWSIENSTTSPAATQPQTTQSSDAQPMGEDRMLPEATGITVHPSDAEPERPRQLDRDILEMLFGGPSEAELMKAAIEVINDPETTLENKLIAFDNFEQLVESLDNANNLEPLGLWTPLIKLMEHEEEEIRKYAAWCVGTAVQNNIKSQERFLAMGGMKPLVGMCMREGETEGNRKKAVYAISSAVRNYQPALEELVRELKEHLGGEEEFLGKWKGKQVVATDMDLVDQICGWLKKRIAESVKA